MPVTDSPLRYPGGKTQLAPFVIDLMRENDLFYGAYTEPFAGGCGIAWKLLLNGFVTEIHINDVDRAIYAFWASVLRSTDDLCERIESTKINMREWHKQRAVLADGRSRILDLGFATLFLNRTNRSGILKGGVIGGKDQLGDYPLDCRFNKAELVAKIKRIALNRERIHLTRLDAEEFVRERLPKLNRHMLVNLDPPYFKAGPGLYCSFYEEADHRSLSKAIARIKQYWIVTYDDAPEIRGMYQKFPTYTKRLQYYAQDKRVGVELMVVDPRLRLPKQSRSAA